MGIMPERFNNTSAPTGVPIMPAHFNGTSAPDLPTAWYAYQRWVPVRNLSAPEMERYTHMLMEVPHVY